MRGANRGEGQDFDNGEAQRDCPEEDREERVNRLYTRAFKGDADALTELFATGYPIGLINYTESDDGPIPDSRLSDEASPITVQAVSSYSSIHSPYHRARHQLWLTLNLLERSHERETDGPSTREDERSWRKSWMKATKQAASAYRVLLESMTNRLHHNANASKLFEGPNQAQQDAVLSLCVALEKLESATPSPSKSGRSQDWKADLGQAQLDQLKEKGFRDKDLADLILASNGDWRKPPCPNFTWRWSDNSRTGKGGGRVLLMEWMTDRRRKRQRGKTPPL